jgi:ribosomal protein L13
MAGNKDEFQFPDEIEIEVEGDDIDIEVQDDTPPEDRNVDPLPEDIITDLEDADSSEEYSRKVKTKFTQYKKAWHDERRAKEEAFREQNEALTMAQKMLDENKRLKNLLHTGEKELISTYQNSTELELEKAKRNYREAYDSGDTDRIIDAQQEIVTANLKADKAKNYRPTVQEEETSVQQQYIPQQPVQMDSKVAEWVAQNPWFRDPTKKTMSRFARGVHEDLSEQYGQAFVGTDAYYKAIDKEVKHRFPEEFGDNENNDEPKTQRTQKLSTVVAPAKRSTSSKKVILTKTQVALAKKFGLSPEQYARELTKLEA